MEGQVNCWVCLLAGFILSFPYILWEIWKFISPALYKNEKKNARHSSFLRYFSLLGAVWLLYCDSHVS
jgi:sec-independent protein translocase protein TatC